MKIGILSDMHFGYLRFYEDSFTQFEEAFKGACDNSDLVLIPGDLFDTRIPKLEVIKRAIKLFEYGKTMIGKSTNADGELPVVAITGTHDRRSREATNPVHVIEQAGSVTNADDRCVIFEKDGEKVAIWGFGAIPEEYAKEELKKINPTPIPGAYNILMFHQTIKDLIPMAPGLEFSDLPEGFDLYLDGHIHKRFEMTKDGKRLLIPGSTVLTQLKKEETEPRAYVIFDTKTGEAKYVDINSRPFYHKKLNFTDTDFGEIRKECKRIIDGFLAEDKSDRPIIKLQLKGNVKEGLKKENIDLSSLIEEYGERAHLEIDNSLSSLGLKDRIDSLRKMYEEKKSMKEIGISMLKEKSKGVDNVEDLFELLSSDKNIDEYIERIKEKARKSQTE